MVGLICQYFGTQNVLPTLLLQQSESQHLAWTILQVALGSVVALLILGAIVRILWFVGESLWEEPIPFLASFTGAFLIITLIAAAIVPSLTTAALIGLIGAVAIVVLAALVTYFPMNRLIGAPLRGASLR